jgi:hypothetical protein
VCSRRETDHPRARVGGFLTLETAGVNGKK